MNDIALRSGPFPRLRATYGYDLAMRSLGALWFLALAVATGFPDPHVVPTPLQAVAKACLVGFYLILCGLLLMRPPAKAHGSGLAPRVAAFVGTYLPWTMGFVSPESRSPVLDLLSAGLVLLGMVLTIVTVTRLGQAFSLTPQARKLVRSGPYRWLRHPLYAAEEVAVFGTLLQFLSPLAVAIFLVHLTVQVCRILYEENLLRSTFPDYAAYAATTWRLVPRVW
jgi:protein-S-isoprenylcysteine O-methyltransferase Ste14